MYSEQGFLAVTLNKHYATSNRLPPRRPTLELVQQAKLYLSLKKKKIQFIRAKVTDRAGQLAFLFLATSMYGHLSVRVPHSQVHMNMGKR